MAAIFISRHFDFGKHLKNIFPKELFNEIWLKVGEHEKFYITEIIKTTTLIN